MVYIFENADAVSLELLDKFNFIYTEERIEKSRKYLKEEDRKKCLMAYIVLLYALKSEYDIFEKIQFEYKINKKPFLEKYKNIFFNISHSSSEIAVALSKNNVGVDIERIIYDYNSIADSVFSHEEKNYIYECDSEKRATKLWTFKESYLKYKGTGLTDDIKKYQFAYQDDVFEKYGCLFKTFSAEKYYVSVCSETDMKIKYIDVKDIIKLVR